MKLKTLNSALCVVLCASLLLFNLTPALALGEVPTPPVELAPAPPTEPVTTIVTPPADTTAPVISGVAANSVTQVAAAIVWTTDELATSRLEYGTTQNLGSSAIIDASALLAHTAVLTGLAASTVYYYCIHATDTSGNTANSCGHTFTTAADTDTAAPLITSITTVAVTSTVMSVAWTTNEPADSQIEYGLTSNYGLSTPLQTTLELAHIVTISGLNPDTEYHYRIRSADALGNAVFSADATFVTPAVALVSDPNSVIAPIVSAVVVVSVSTTVATITWLTNEPADTQIEYGLTANYGLATTLDTTLGNAHTVTLTGLTPNTTYHYLIKSKNAAGTFAVTADGDFSTLAESGTVGVEVMLLADTTAPIISGIAESSLSTVEATIVWNTDEITTSRIRYGATTNYGHELAVSLTGGLVHTGTLVNLTPNTTYHYCIDATDLAGNVTHSCGHTFSTQAEQVLLDSNPPAVSVVTISPIASFSAAINWITDEVANGQVEYGLTASYGTQTPLNTALSLQHSVLLSSLSPNTTYHYRSISRDEIGNTFMTLDNTFTTEPANKEPIILPPVPEPELPTDPTPTAPEVSAPEVGLANLAFHTIGADSLATSTATIVWQTSVPADSLVEYGETSNLGGVSEHISDLTTTHEVTITGLTAGTLYYFRVVSAPALGGAIASEIHDFTTLPQATVVDSAANILSVATSSIQTTSASIAWNTNELAIGQVEYGLTTAYGEILTSIQSGINHSVSLADLSPGTVYHFRVKAVDAGGNETFSIDHTFTTAGTVLAEESSAVAASPASVSAGGGTSGGGFSGSVSGGGTNNLPPGIPMLVRAAPADGQNVFMWDNPTTPGFASVVLVRNASSYPESASDGEVIYRGAAGTFTDTNVQNGVTYYYSLFSYSVAGQYSSPIRISLAPKQGIEEIKLEEVPVLEQTVPEEHFSGDLTFGVKSLEVTHMQQILNVAGVHVSRLTTGYFGNLTQTALKKFQQKYGLAVTGEADADTRDMLSSIAASQILPDAPSAVLLLDHDLKRGDQEEAVGYLQEFLDYEGSFPEAVVDNNFDAATQQAVIRFQKKYGVTPTIGYVGYKTRHTIEAVSGL